jgi:hypothetical protein
VDDLLADIDRGAIKVERDLDYVNRTDHAGAETARLQEENLLVCAGIRGDGFQRHKYIGETPKYIIGEAIELARRVP